MENFTDIELPDYSPSIPPDYSSTPLPGERCIQWTPKRTAEYRENCAFTYEQYGMSLTLRGCREEHGVPTFGLCSSVNGEFAPADRDRKRILSISVKLEGQIRVKIKGRVLSYTLMCKERLLWRRDDSTNDACPSLLPVSLSFPSAYLDKHHGRPHRLPPSILISDPYQVAIVYSLDVIVRKAPCSIFSLSKEVCLSAHLSYSPRVRPPRPSPLSFSSLKICPEDWQEEIWGMSKASKEDEVPLIAQCHFFVPSVRVFSSSEIVPFHISFCASTPFLSSVAGHVGQANACLEKPIHVFFLRRTTVTVEDSNTVHEEILGTGRVIPNPITAIEPISDDTTTLSWDGEIHSEQPIEFSSFTTSVIQVRDFLVISLLVPPGPLKSIPRQLYQAFPIRLVTHPWIDRS